MDRGYVFGTLLALSGVGAITAALMVSQLHIGYRSSRDLWGWTVLGDLPLWTIVPLMLAGLLAIAYGNSYRDRSTTGST